MRFRSSAPGQVTGIRFWKDSQEIGGTHTGHLWDAAGGLLATVTFTGETASGWQRQDLPAPVTVAPVAKSKPVVARTLYVFQPGLLVPERPPPTAPALPECVRPPPSTRAIE